MTDQSPPSKKGTPIIPAPDNASTFDGLKLSGSKAVHTYVDQAGKLLQHIVRFERPDSDNPSKTKKSFCPYTYVKQPDGSEGWEIGALPAPRPIYGGELLACQPDFPVLIVEGEKCADAARVVFPDVIVVTWPGGSNATKQVDFSPLVGRVVHLLPDFDVPGRKAMDDIAKELSEIGAKRVCHLETPLSATLKTIPEAETDPVHAAILAHYNCIVDLPEELQLSEQGLFKKTIDRRGQEKVIFLGSPMYVIGRTKTTAGGGGYGHLIAFKTPIGVWDTVVIPATMLAGDGREMRNVLARVGVTFGQGGEERLSLMEVVSYSAPDSIIEVAAKTGWHGSAFAFPDCVFSPPNAPKILPPDLQGVEHFFKTAGCFDTWKDMVGQVKHSSRLVLGISVALSAPLAQLLGESGGIFHLHGKSSTGKTTVLAVSGSVFGGGGRDGAVKSWSMTANGGEAEAANHSDLPLILDEIHLANPDEISDLVYRMVNGKGKARATKDGRAAQSAQWQAMILSSGETTLANRINSERRKKVSITGGLATRLIDIPHAAAEDRTFEGIGGYPTEEAFVRAVREVAMTHYGHAGYAFLRHVVDERASLQATVSKLVDTFVSHATDPNDDPQVRRVARRFGLAAAAGTLASRWGIVPWPDATAERAALACFRAWLEARGTTTAQEEISAIQQVSAFFEAHGTSRFEEFSRNMVKGENSIARSSLMIRDRCGYREDDDGPIWYVLPSAWRDEICAEIDPKFVAKLKWSH